MDVWKGPIKEIEIEIEFRIRISECFIRKRNILTRQERLSEWLEGLVRLPRLSHVAGECG